MKGKAKEIRKLWPIEQLLDWINKSNSKYVNLTTSEYLVLIIILKFANNYFWKAHPSIETIANLALKDGKHVEDIIKRLVLKGILSVKERYTKYGDRDSNEYTIYPDKIWGVGANSPLRWGQIYPYGGGKSTPLTTNLTTPITKKPRYCSNQDQKKRNETHSIVPDYVALPEEPKASPEVVQKELDKIWEALGVRKKFQ